MSKTIDRLRDDHRRIRNILETIQEVAVTLPEDDTGTQTDLIFCLVDYLAEYPDKIHHPMEDRVFDKMSATKMTDQQLEMVQSNRLQHRKLQAATTELADLVDTLSGEIDVDRFLATFSEFADQQIRHMKHEERDIFPLAIELIPEAMWKELDKQIIDAKDPLYDKADRRFSALYEYLIPDEMDSDQHAQPLLQYLKAADHAKRK